MAATVRTGPSKPVDLSPPSLRGPFPKKLVSAAECTRFSIALKNGATPLHYAILRGDDEAVRKLASKNSQWLHCTFQGVRPLEMAVMTSRDVACRILIEKGASPEVRIQGSVSLLHIAVGMHSTRVVQVLLAKKDSGLVHSKDYNGHTPLHLAARIGSASLCEMLIEQGANVFTRDNEGMHALHHALAGANQRRGGYDAIRYLAQDPYLLRDPGGPSGLTPIKFAVVLPDPEPYQILSQAGAHPPQLIADPTPIAAPRVRAQPENTDVMSLLVKKPEPRKTPWAAMAAVRQNPYTASGCVACATELQNQFVSMTPLHMAIMFGSDLAVEELAKNKRWLNVKLQASKTDRISPRSPLHLAIMCDRSTAFEALVRAGANYAEKVTGEEGRNLLHMAVILGRVRIAQILLNQGGLLSSVSDSGVSALHYAVGIGSIDLCELLIQEGANPLAKSAAGNNPLHCALFTFGDPIGGNLSVVRCLAKYSVLLNDKNAKGETPVDLAAALPDQEPYRILLQAMVPLKASASAVIPEPVKGAKQEASRAASINPFEQAQSASPGVLPRPNPQAEPAQTPLHTAVLQDNEAAVELHAQNKDWINAKDKNGDTPFLLAARHASRTVCAQLILAGADPTITRAGSGRSALHRAIEGRKLDCVELLTNIEGALSELPDSSGNTPFVFAAYLNYTQESELLLETGVNILAVGTGGRTALHWAAFHGNSELIRILIDLFLESIKQEAVRPNLEALSTSELNQVWEGFRRQAIRPDGAGLSLSPKASQVLKYVLEKNAKFFGVLDRNHHAPIALAKQRRHFKCSEMLAEGQMRFYVFLMREIRRNSCR